MPRARSSSPFKRQFQQYHFEELFESNLRYTRSGPYSPDHHLKFTNRSSSDLLPYDEDENDALQHGDFDYLAKKDQKAIKFAQATGQAIPNPNSGFDPDDRAQFLALQEARRQKLWSEVHDGFKEVVVSFQEFHQILHGDVESLGLRLTDRQKQKMKEKLQQQKYIEGLENRIKELIEEKKSFTDQMAQQEYQTNLYYSKFQSLTQLKREKEDFEASYYRLRLRSDFLTVSARTWFDKFQVLNLRYFELVRKLSNWFSVEIGFKAKAKQIWDKWCEFKHLNILIKGLNDAQQRLITERDHWMQVTHELREELQYEKDQIDFLIKRMKKIGCGILEARVRTYINPSSCAQLGPEYDGKKVIGSSRKVGSIGEDSHCRLHYICFRLWKKEALSYTGSIRCDNKYLDLIQENNYNKARIEHLEAVAGDFQSQVMDMFTEQLSEVEEKNETLTKQLFETQQMALEDERSSRFIKLADERKDQKRRRFDLERRVKQAWTDDVKLMYEECYYLQQRNLNLETLIKEPLDGDDPAKKGQKGPKTAVVPKEFGYRCIDCTKKILYLQEIEGENISPSHSMKHKRGRSPQMDSIYSPSPGKKMRSDNGSSPDYLRTPPPGSQHGSQQSPHHHDHHGSRSRSASPKQQFKVTTNSRSVLEQLSTRPPMFQQGAQLPPELFSAPIHDLSRKQLMSSLENLDEFDRDLVIGGKARSISPPRLPHHVQQLNSSVADSYPNNVDQNMHNIGILEPCAAPNSIIQTQQLPQNFQIKGQVFGSSCYNKDNPDVNPNVNPKFPSNPVNDKDKELRRHMKETNDRREFGAVKRALHNGRLLAKTYGGTLPGMQVSEETRQLQLEMKRKEQIATGEIKDSGDDDDSKYYRMSSDGSMKIPKSYQQPDWEGVVTWNEGESYRIQKINEENIEQRRQEIEEENRQKELKIRQEREELMKVRQESKMKTNKGIKGKGKGPQQQSDPNQESENLYDISAHLTAANIIRPASVFDDPRPEPEWPYKPPFKSLKEMMPKKNKDGSTANTAKVMARDLVRGLLQKQDLALPTLGWDIPGAGGIANSVNNNNDSPSNTQTKNLRRKKEAWGDNSNHVNLSENINDNDINEGLGEEFT